MSATTIPNAIAVLLRNLLPAIFFTAVSFTSVAQAQEQACLHASAAFGVGYTGCFDGIEHECVGNDSWVVRGTCTSGNPTDGTPVAGLPEAMDGPLCLAGTYYSPSAERCNGGHYQTCETSTHWSDRTPPDDYACR